MLRNIFSIVIIILLSVLLAIISANYTVKNFSGFNKRIEDIWINSPYASSKQADPYEKAYSIHNAIITLGKAEGLSFWTKTDSNRKLLQANCDYKLTIFNLPADFFTIYATNNQLAPLKNTNNFPYFLLSKQLVKNQDNNAIIYVSKQPYSGNWLSINSNSNYMLVINLYNTPLVTPSGVRKVKMPKIEKLSCNINKGKQ
ncbi:DUF1214 domain-containing protein [Bartonella sp. DGB1]|uniref:DUF1214 domain-containing protein n=1 Tax=Bartonella sp. DGB1 TaxID=3239807 RepID=UPI003524007E